MRSDRRPTKRQRRSRSPNPRRLLRSRSPDLRRFRSPDLRRSRSPNLRRSQSPDLRRCRSPDLQSRRGTDQPVEKSYTEVPGLYEWGKYGEITLKDFHAKAEEFQGWLSENGVVRSGCLQEEHELFKDYIEDYNTATLPHEKWYDLARWEAKGAFSTHTMVFDDERERERALRAAAESRRVLLVQEAYNKIAGDEDLAAAMRKQRMLKEKADQCFREGRNEEAQRIVARLKPDKPILHVKEEKAPHNDYDY